MLSDVTPAGQRHVEGLDSQLVAFILTSTLSSCMHAVVALLYPFSWQHTFIPVLPGSMLDIVCCPTPFLVGLLSSSLPKLKELPVEEVSSFYFDHLLSVHSPEETINTRNKGYILSSSTASSLVMAAGVCPSCLRDRSGVHPG